LPYSFRLSQLVHEGFTTPGEQVGGNWSTWYRSSAPRHSWYFSHGKAVLAKTAMALSQTVTS